MACSVSSDVTPAAQPQPVGSLLISVQAPAWNLLGLAFGPCRTVPLRIVLLGDGGLQVSRADGRPLGGLARRCREAIAQARVELEEARRRETANATKRVTRQPPPKRAEAVIRQTPEPSPQTAPEETKQQATEKAKTTTGVFRVDRQTVTDRITRLRQERPEPEPALEPLSPSERERRHEQTRAIARIRELREQAQREAKRDGSDIFASDLAASPAADPPPKTTSGMFRYDKEAITDRINRVRRKGDSGLFGPDGAQR